MNQPLNTEPVNVGAVGSTTFLFFFIDWVATADAPSGTTNVISYEGNSITVNVTVFVTAPSVNVTVVSPVARPWILPSA